MKRHLCAGADNQPFVLVPIRDDDMRLDGGLLHLMDAVLALDNKICFGPGGVSVTEVGVNLTYDIALNIGDANHIWLIVDARRMPANGFFGIKNGWQNLVFNLNRVYRLLR